jgi:hypothetical protein
MKLQIKLIPLTLQILKHRARTSCEESIEADTNPLLIIIQYLTQHRNYLLALAYLLISLLRIKNKRIIHRQWEIKATYRFCNIFNLKRKVSQAH